MCGHRALYPQCSAPSMQPYAGTQITHSMAHPFLGPTDTAMVSIKSRNQQASSCACFKTSKTHCQKCWPTTLRNIPFSPHPIFTHAFLFCSFSARFLLSLVGYYLTCLIMSVHPVKQQAVAKSIFYWFQQIFLIIFIAFWKHSKSTFSSE